MESRIGQLHYRVRATPGVRVPPGLGRVARERVGEALGEALDAALGEDPGVYVLRQLRADLTVDVGAHPPDRLVARRWADRLAAAITRAIAEDGGDSVARFADEDEFIARFAADLADGVAWERWFYGAFAELRPLGQRSALRKVLLDNRGRLPAILAWLARHGTLERVLAALDSRTLAVLERRLPDPELVRPLVAAALRIAVVLDLAPYRDDRPRPAGRPLPGGGADRADVARAGLARRRRFGRLPFPRARRARAVAGPASEPRTPGAAWSRCSPSSTGSMWTGSEPGCTSSWRPARRRRLGARASADPVRDLRLVRELAAAVGHREVALDARDPTSAANALRLQAAFAAWMDEVAALRAAPATIAALLEAIGRLARHRAAPELWALVAAGDARGAWRRYAEGGGSAEDVELLAEAEPLVMRFAPGCREPRGRRAVDREPLRGRPAACTGSARPAAARPVGRRGGRAALSRAACWRSPCVGAGRLRSGSVPTRG